MMMIYSSVVKMRLLFGETLKSSSIGRNNSAISVSAFSLSLIFSTHDIPVIPIAVKVMSNRLSF